MISVKLRMDTQVKILQLIYHALFAFSLTQISWHWLGVGFLSYLLLSKIGAELSLHRWITHRSFKTDSLRGKVLLFFAVFSGLGSTLAWAGTHRLHHMHSDTPQDPHSPIHQHPLKIYFTFWQPFHIPRTIISDLLRDPLHVFIHRHYFFIHIAAIVLLGFINIKVLCFGLAWGSVFAFHIAGLINTVSHLYGDKTFQDSAGTNNRFLNFLLLGSSLHNNHHKHPTSYTNSADKNDIDLFPWFIRHFWSVDETDVNSKAS